MILLIVTGPFSTNFSSLTNAFSSVLTNSIGITLVEENYRYFPKSFRDFSFIISIGNYFIKLLMINFALVIIFHFYRKRVERQQEKLEEKQMKEEEMKRIVLSNRKDNNKEQ